MQQPIKRLHLNPKFSNFAKNYLSSDRDINQSKLPTSSSTNHKPIRIFSCSKFITVLALHLSAGLFVGFFFWHRPLSTLQFIFSLIFGINIFTLYIVYILPIYIMNEYFIYRFLHVFFEWFTNKNCNIYFVFSFFCYAKYMFYFKLHLHVGKCNTNHWIYWSLNN